MFHHFGESFFSSFETFDKSSTNCAGSTLCTRTCQGCPACSNTPLASLLARGSGVLLHCVLGGSLYHCALDVSIALLHPGWSPFGGWCCLHLPAFLGSQNLWMNAAAAGLEPAASLGRNWGKFLSFYPLPGTRGQILGLLSPLWPLLWSVPWAAQGQASLLKCVHFVCVPGRMLGEWAS